MKEFKIKEELANKILNYLANKPYQEVVILIGELQTITPVEETNKEIK